MPEVTETTPLVSHNTPNKTTLHSYVWKILPLAFIVLVLDSSAFLSVGPETALFEQIACRNYYGSLNSVHGNKCKVEPVQSEVAFIIAWRQSLEILPGLICAIPLGALADRIGPKKVLLCSILGCFVSDVWVRAVCWFPNIFPLRLVLFSGVWQFFGGGATTLSSMIWLMIVDKTPAEHRSSAFAHIQATILIAEFTSIMISAPLMNISPWIPYLLASCCMLTGFILALVWIEESSSREETAQDSSAGLHLKDMVQMVGWLRSHLHVFFLLSSFCTIEIGLQVANILVQYASKRFSWTISHATYMIMIRSLTSLILLISMPLLTKTALATWSDMRVVVYEKRYTQVSLFFLMIGSIASFAAFHPAALISGQILFSLGSGYHVTARSLITAMVDQKHLGTLYGAIAVASYCGILAGGPLIAFAFSYGMRIGGMWIGLPYLVAAGSLCFTLAMVSFARLKQIESTADDSDN